MGRSRRVWLAIVGLVALAQVGTSVPADGNSVPPPDPSAEHEQTVTSGIEATGAVEAAAESARWLRTAGAVQAVTRTHLRVSDEPRCADASYVSYRRSDLLPTVADQWYVASQLWADAELLRATDRQPGRLSDDEARCQLARGFAFLGRLVEGGGYYARAAPDGSDVARGVHYTDDNALAGLSLLAAADVETDPVARQSYLIAARRVAVFLTTSGLWDEVFGGGFWWNSNKGDRWEGKPAQSNALAALFFARLGAATADDAYREWAVRTLGWLDGMLYHPEVRLYRWSARYEDMRARTGGPILYSRYFNYDQALVVEAQVHTARLDGRADRLDRAREVGQVMHVALWNATHGGYNLEVGVDRLYASYGAWASLGHLALYDLDGDRRWLEMARLNADALDVMFRREDGSYGYRHFRCQTPVERSRPGCEGGESSWVLDQTRDGSAQAWMQHLQAALGRRLARQST